MVAMIAQDHGSFLPVGKYASQQICREGFEDGIVNNVRNAADIFPGYQTQ
jgi:hypothetical protein